MIFQLEHFGSLAKPSTSAAVPVVPAVNHFIFYAANLESHLRLTSLPDAGTILSPAWLVPYE